MLKKKIDVDWVGDTNEMKSTIGYSFTLGFVMISWENKKGPSIMLSTIKV